MKYATSIWSTDWHSAKCTPLKGRRRKPDAAEQNTVSIRLDPDCRYQEMLGFGGAFNEVGWEALKSLDESKRDEVMRALFGEEGCNFRLNRSPIGASDFALDAYSLDDVDGDFDMKHFSIERDKKCLLLYIREALKAGPDMKVWGCPWSPPYWLKTNKNMCRGGELIDRDEYLRAYAKYLRKYVDAYKNEDIPLHAICIQNETDVINVYPTSTMMPDLMRKFLRAYLIPEMLLEDKRRFDVEIWAGTIRDIPGYADDIVTDPVIKEFVKGIAFQYSSAAAVADARLKHPSFRLLHTESPCYNGANSVEEAKGIFRDIVLYLENGCSNYCYWNMVLDETGLSTWNWKQNSMVTVDRNKKEVVYNPEYYVMQQFGRFVAKGARRIKAEGLEGAGVAFINPDDSIVAVMSNFTDSDRDVRLDIKGEILPFSLAAGVYIQSGWTRSKNDMGEANADQFLKLPSYILRNLY
jgi:glucosylceramidase